MVEGIGHGRIKRPATPLGACLRQVCPRQKQATKKAAEAALFHTLLAALTGWQGCRR